MAFPVCGTESGSQIADASVWINLAATGRLAEVLEALSAPISIAEVALCELERGRTNGHGAYGQIYPMVQSGQIQAVSISAAEEDLYLGLVAGGTAETLDDGEAATLALAVSLSAIAVIDERKATTLANRRFPLLEIRSTTDLLFETLPYEGHHIGPLAEALFGALQGARMRVPAHWQSRVIDVLGCERASLCSSLPAHLRMIKTSLGEDGGQLLAKHET